MSSLQSHLTTIGFRLGMRAFRPWEATGIRALFAWLIYRILPLDPPGHGDWFGKNGWLGTTGRVVFDSQASPRGLANFFDVTFMSNEALQPWLWAICGLALLSYIIGRGLIVSIPVLFLVITLARSLENSQGFVYHGYKLAALVLLAQMIVVFVHTVNRFLKKRQVESALPQYSLNDYLIRFAQVAIIAGYIVAGMSKLIESQGKWLVNSHYTGVYLVKTYRQNHYKRLDTESFGEERVPYANEMLESPTLTRIFMSGGLFLELFCFIALWNRWLALGTGISLVIFHRLVDEIMNLQFLHNEIICWIFLVNPVFWIGLGVIWLANRMQQKQPVNASSS